MISVKEKVAYGLGDTASNIIFQTVMLFLAFFYTDIFGLSPAVVGTLFLVVRIFDAVTDPLMGTLADRTNTKYGKFRPYILWLTIPFGLISMLTFTTPDLSDTGKVIYAFITYSLLMIAYTAINIPYSALGAVLTENPKERVSIQSYRFVFGMLGGLIVAGLTLPMVEWFGQGDKATGYQFTMIAMSLAGMIMFWLCFAGTKERLSPPVDQTFSFKKDFSAVWHNDQWRILCIAVLFLLMGMVIKTSLAIYYVKYYLGMENWVTTFITVGMIGNILGCSLANHLAKRICKVKAYISIQVLSAFICISCFWIPPEQYVLATFAYFVWCFILQMATPLLWAKMADTVDYGVYLSGDRLTGLVYSSIVFFIKLGLAVGGALVGWLLAYYGYQADIEQSEHTLFGILFGFAFLPAIGSLLVAVVMSRYRLTDGKMSEIQNHISKNDNSVAGTAT